MIKTEHEYCFICDRPVGPLGSGNRTKNEVGPICDECLKEFFDLGLRKLGTGTLHEFCECNFEAHSVR